MVGPWQQCLRYHASQTFGQHHADLCLLPFWENINHPVNRLDGAIGVQRAEDEVAGFSSRDGQRNRFQIAQLSYQNDVRIFAQRSSQRRAE